MLVEKEIEAKVVSQIATALSGVANVKVVGTWQSSNAGVVQGVCEEDDMARVVVATGSPEYDSWTVPLANVPVSIGVVIRQELAPTAAEIESVMSPIETLLVGWQLSDQGLSSLTTTHFRVDGVRLDAGDPPQFSANARLWRMSRGLTVRGAIIQQ